MIKRQYFFVFEISGSCKQSFHLTKKSWFSDFDGALVNATNHVAKTHNLINLGDAFCIHASRVK